MTAVPLAADSDLPELPSNHASVLYGWTADLPELWELLKKGRHSLKAALDNRLPLLPIG